MTSWIAAVNEALTAAFDAFFDPFRSANPLAPLAVLSVLAGIVMLLVFRITTDQKSLRAAKDRLQAQLLAVRMFQDQLGVVMRAYGRILRGTLSYLRFSLLPLLVLLVPFFVVFVQMDLRLGHTAPQPGEPFLLKAHLRASSPAPGSGAASSALAAATDPLLDQLALHLPEGLAQTAPPVHIPAQNEVDWRLEARQPGDYTCQLLVGGQQISKDVRITRELEALSEKRVRANSPEMLLEPAEAPLPPDSPLESVEVSYAPRSVGVAGFATHWIVIFLVISTIAAFALKGVLGVEF